GPHGRGWLPWGRGLTLGALEAAPHGIDLGALAPAPPRPLAAAGGRGRLAPPLPGALRTPDGRVALAPAPLLADLARVRGGLTAEAEGSSLALVGRRHLHSNNSWMHNSARLVKGRERCVLLMHPADARERDLRDGDRVRVRSRAGEVEAALRVTDEMRPGVVSLPHGWGHGRHGIRLRVAAERPG